MTLGRPEERRPAESAEGAASGPERAKAEAAVGKSTGGAAEATKRSRRSRAERGGAEGSRALAQEAVPECALSRPAAEAATLRLRPELRSCTPGAAPAHGGSQRSRRECSAPVLLSWSQ